MAAAETEARKNNWPVTIAIVDTTGSLSMLLKLDNTGIASVDIAVGKARTALEFRRPTKALQDTVAAGGAGMRLLSLRGAFLIDGGVPIVIDGTIVGAIGVSGVLGEQDAQVAAAGAAAAKVRCVKQVQLFSTPTVRAQQTMPIRVTQVVAL